MVVNAGKATVVESKCSPVQPAYGELASLCPQNRTLHWSDGNEEVSITPPSNCALQLQASFRQSMVEAAARQYAKSRHGALRILRRHIPDSLGTGRGRKQQQERTCQYTKKQHGFFPIPTSRSQGRHC